MSAPQVTSGSMGLCESVEQALRSADIESVALREEIARKMKDTEIATDTNAVLLDNFHASIARQSQKLYMSIDCCDADVSELLHRMGADPTF